MSRHTGSRGFALLLVKLAACIFTGLFNWALWNQHGPTFQNFLILCIFVCALVSLSPRFGWISSSIILGACVGPEVFAPNINGSTEQDINGAIIGAVVGLIIGVVAEVWWSHHPNSGADKV